jgi:predicted DsbA family dithiol-disulfide isomerase
MQVKIIHYASPTCSICTTQDRILEELKENSNIDYEAKSITTAFDDALKYGVKSAPTLVYLVDNKAMVVRPGFQSKERILAEVGQLQKSLST